MKIQESAENYLETILILSERSTYVRSIDIANELNFTKPSVSVAMKKLRENNLITVDGDGYIHLTEDGLAIANRMYAPQVAFRLAHLSRRAEGHCNRGRLPH